MAAALLSSVASETAIPAFSLDLRYAESCQQPTSIECPATQEVTITKYEGARAADGLLEGTGYAEFTSGNKYNGDFQQGHMHGRGEYVWVDGLVYTGDFVKNKITGTGVYKWPSGATYEGGVLNGKRSGFGTMRFAGNDVVYAGDWQDSKRHGQGKLVFDKAQLCFYEGGWSNNLKHGQGVMHYNSGNTYTGGWEGDQKQGKGRMQWGQGEMYIGQWAAGLQNGIGQHVWLQPALLGAALGSNHAFFLMHNRYEGQFKNGQRHGYGALHYATGAKYEGEWQSEQKHGRGVFIFEDGTVFDGMFADDQPVLRGGELWSPVGPGVKLRVQDLLGDSDSKQVLLALSNELLCVNTELRVVYDAYSTRQQGMPWGWGRPQHSAALTSAQMWQLMRDCNIPEPDCSLAHINAAIAQACASPTQTVELRQQLASPEVALAVEGGRPSVHSPVRQLLFWDFCEALVRIAYLKYRHLPSLQQRLHHLLHSHILPHAVKSGTTKLWLQQQAETAVQALESATLALQPLFLQIAGQDPSSTTSNASAEAAAQIPAQGSEGSAKQVSVSAPQTQQSHASSSSKAEEGRSEDERQLAWTVCTASIRRVLQTMQQRQLLGAGVSSQQALTAFQSACYASSQAQNQEQENSSDLADILNLDSGIIFPEFVEGLARCCSQEAAVTGQESWVEPLRLLLTKVSG